jgi:hypothetical protein
MKFDLQNLMLGTILVILIAGASWYGYNEYVAPQEEETKDPTGAKVPVSEIYSGNIKWVIDETDFLATGSHTSTNEIFYLFNSEPMDESDAGGGNQLTTSGEVVDLPAENKGWAWIGVHNGDDEYMIAQWLESTFKGLNSRCKEIKWRDITGDDKDEMICKFWVGDIKVGSSQDPVVTIQFPWIDEDVSGITEDSPSDQSSIGTGSGTTVTITWLFSGLAEEDGYVIGKLYFVTNDTREGNDVRLKNLELSGGVDVYGKTSWSVPESTSAGDYEAYYFNPKDYTDPMDGILVYRDTDAPDQLYVTLTIDCYFEASDCVTVDVYMETVGGDGATTQVTDSVSLVA